MFTRPCQRHRNFDTRFWKNICLTTSRYIHSRRRRIYYPLDKIKLAYGIYEVDHILLHIVFSASLRLCISLIPPGKLKAKQLQDHRITGNLRKNIVIRVFTLQLPIQSVLLCNDNKQHSLPQQANKCTEKSLKLYPCRPQTRT